MRVYGVEQCNSSIASLSSSAIRTLCAHAPTKALLRDAGAVGLLTTLTKIMSLSAETRRDAAKALQQLNEPQCEALSFKRVKVRHQ